MIIVAAVFIKAQGQIDAKIYKRGFSLMTK